MGLAEQWCLDGCGLLSGEKVSPFPSSQSWACQAEVGLGEGRGAMGTW